MKLSNKGKMASQIQIVAHEEVEEGFLTKIQTWANEVLERGEFSFSPFYLCIAAWKTMEKLQAFYREEKEALGVVTGEETDFLATHDAWRGYPRVHICQERLKGVPSAIVQGVIHHEISHALHHGTPEFYTFRFSRELQEVGRSRGLDLPLLQQFVYLLSVAIKDRDVVQWLAGKGLASGQLALLEHFISETEEERGIWELVRRSSALRKIAFASFLKTLLPIEALISAGVEDAQTLRDQWNEAYGWLSLSEREDLSRFAQCSMDHGEKSFQERLEQTALQLITQR
ncbi:MAG: hypothetical protein KAJ09_07200 [Deltaproteobacteria bacterium]|nr:hypothetical protein [Deltaproteobacteria bacterium]